MSKGFWGVIAGIILIFVGIFAFSSKTDDGSKSGNNSGKTLTQHVQGNGTSGVTLIEYGDYQCPYCQQYYATVKAVQAKFNDEIKFQFRNYPLVNAHPNAFAAARAAEAAALQNKFWEMHDALYEPQNYQVWTRATDPNSAFQGYAKQLGLNVSQFKTDFASSVVNDLINADLAEGTKLKITGTPTFFLDGKKVEIANSLAAFEKVINEAIAKKAAAAKPAATPAQ